MTTLAFETARGNLTPLVETDAATIAGWYRNPEFTLFYRGSDPTPKAEAQLCEEIDQWRTSHKYLMLGFRTRADGQLVGIGGLDEILWYNRVGWFAVALAPDVWGQGLGAELSSALLALAFGTLGLHKVQLTVCDYNPRAIALYRRLGFQHEGTNREVIYRGGRYHDLLTMGLLDREWRAKQV